MYNNIYHLLIHLLAITYINSVIKFNIEINNQIYTLDHDKINNSSEEENPNAALINQNIYLCEDKTDCITCSFSMYQYASCYWDCDHSQCKTEYFTSSFGFTNDLSSIYQICSTCDTTSNEKMFRNCNDSILFKEDSIKNKKNNDTYINKFDYSKVDFKGLLCKYTVYNKFKKRESLLHLNITKFYRYINMYVILEYGLYSRHINLKSKKNYEIDTVGVNCFSIYIYTPENYESMPFTILYSFKMIKDSLILRIVIFMIVFIVLIFSILLILIFIEFKKGNLIIYGKKEYNLSINTLIFRKFKYSPTIFEKYNKKCLFCSNDIIKGSFITELKCKKHIYHYVCLIKWVRHNDLNKTNFFCPLCQGEEIQRFNKSIISKEDNDKLLTNNKSIISNNKGLLDQKTELEDINKKRKDEKIEDEKTEDKKDNHFSENISGITENNNLENNRCLLKENHEDNDANNNEEEDKKEEKINDN